MQKTFFSKKEQDILNLKVRRDIYELVKKFSGCNFRYLERRSAIPAGTLHYHLHFLVKHGLLTTQKDGNKVRYFTKDLATKDKELLAFLRQKSMREILLLMLNKSKCRQKDIIEFIPLAPSTVSWYLTRLREHNIISHVNEKEGTYYHLAVPKSEIVAILVMYKESFFDKLVNQTIDMWEFQK